MCIPFPLSSLPVAQPSPTDIEQASKTFGFEKRRILDEQVTVHPVSARLPTEPRRNQRLLYVGPTSLSFDLPNIRRVTFRPNRSMGYINLETAALRNIQYTILLSGALGPLKRAMRFSASAP